MPESTESKLTESRIACKWSCQTTGAFVLLIIVLSFIAGAVRGELVLILTGAVFLALWTYCLIMTLLLALIHCRRVRKISIRISPREVAAGGQAELRYSAGGEESPRGGIFRLPGILIRCRVLLHTKDGRHIKHDFNPRTMGGPGASRRLPETFEASRRGAYFSDYDEFAVFDALGFFRFAYLLPAGEGPVPAGGAGPVRRGSDARLLASPGPAEEPVPVKARAGESDQRPELTFQRTDNLIDHRPYVPGDDPRRINWKLYGHGGELFVREGEREPPPHSNILILIDTQFDPLLYSVRAARRGVDLLCENALAAALSAPEGGADSGMDVLIGFTGQGGSAGPEFRLGHNSGLSALAWPAAMPLRTDAELPAAPEDRGVLVFALPRASAESSALDRFLRDHAARNAGRNKTRIVELVFLYGSDAESGGSGAYGERAAAAETCAALYNHRPGVRARSIGV